MTCASCLAKLEEKDGQPVGGAVFTCKGNKFSGMFFMQQMASEESVTICICDNCMGRVVHLMNMTVGEKTFPMSKFFG